MLLKRTVQVETRHVLQLDMFIVILYVSLLFDAEPESKHHAVSAKTTVTALLSYLCVCQVDHECVRERVGAMY